MITDKESDIIYLSDCLPDKYPDFFKRLESLFMKAQIPFAFIPDTKDVWAVDFMPIQIKENHFVQFRYDPDYLKSKQYHKTISDVDSICQILNLSPYKSLIIADGGNIVKEKNKVVICDKIFQENKHIPEVELTKQLSQLLEVEDIIFVPWDKNDRIGHADGMVRFINEDTVLINNYSAEENKLKNILVNSLEKHKLNWYELPYNPYSNKTYLSAEGIYINYLQIQNKIVVPIFNMSLDDKAIYVFEELFKGHKIFTIESSDLAKEGGVLNCITWNVKKSF